MNPFKDILVATDTRLDVYPIVEEAAEIAKRNCATLKLVDVVPEFPWISRLMVSDHEKLRQLIGCEKQEKLDSLAAPIREAGINVETKVLWGKTSVEIVREVLRGRHDLVMRVARGHNSSHKGFFGATGRRLLRDCPCAVWLVAAAETPEYKHVLACIDTSANEGLNNELNDRVFEFASNVGDQHHAKTSVLHAWSMDAEQILKGRVSPVHFQEMIECRRAEVASSLDRFLKTHGTSVRNENVHLIKHDPAFAIPTFADENAVDLVVVGTVARSGLAGMVIGNTAERILDDLECSVLAIKPDSFVSPITEDEYIDLAQSVEHAL